MTPEVKMRLAVVKRAAYLKKRVETGKATKAEASEYETIPKGRRGRPSQADLAERDAWIRAHPQEQGPEPDVDASNADASAPVPPTPPRVEVMRGVNKDWRDKYRASFAGGREGACVQVAQLYCSVLNRLSKYIEDSGSRPVLDKATINEVVLPAAVLAADRLMPDIEISPEVEVAIGTGVLVGQASIVAWRRKQRAKANPSNTARPMPPPSETEVTESHAAEAPSNGNYKVPEGSIF